MAARPGVCVRVAVVVPVAVAVVVVAVAVVVAVVVVVWPPLHRVATSGRGVVRRYRPNSYTSHPMNRECVLTPNQSRGRGFERRNWFGVRNDSQNHRA